MPTTPLDAPLLGPGCVSAPDLILADLEDEMRLAVEILVVWLVASPVVGVLLGVAIARARRAASHREAPLRLVDAVPGNAAALAVIPAPTTSPEVLHLRLAPPA